MAKTKTYKVGNDVYDIPENETKDFLSNFSDAIEVESFIVDKDTFDIPLSEIQEFKTQFPTAQPLKKKASTEPIQPDLGSGGTVGASAVQSTESEVFKPKRIGETQIEGEAVDIFQYPKTEVTESPFTDELKATLKRLPTEALVAANEIKKLKRKPTPQELQGIQDKYGITKPEEVDALTKYLEFGLKGEKTVEPSTIDYLSNAWQRGTNNARLSSYINMGRMPTEEELKTIAEINRFELPTSKITERFNNAPDLNSAIKELAVADASDFALWLAENVVQSFGTLWKGSPKVMERALQSGAVGAGVGTAIPAIGTAAGGMTGAGYGYIVGMGEQSANVEYANTFINTLAESGVDITAEKSLKEALNNENLIKEAKKKAMLRGVPVGFFDGLSAGIGGKIVTQPGKSAFGKMAKALAEPVVQAGLGGAGAAAGQLASEGKITDGKEIFTEIVAEFGTSPVEILTGSLRSNKLKSENKPYTVSKNKTELFKIFKGATKEEIDFELARQVSLGKITEEQKQMMSDLIMSMNEADKVTPQGIPNRDEAVVIISEKKELEKEAENVDTSFQPIVQDQITQLSNNLLDLVSGTTTTPTVSEPIQPTTATPQEQGVEETVSESVSEVGDGTAETATTVLEPLSSVEATAKALKLENKTDEELNDFWEKLSESKNNDVGVLANMIENLEESRERNSVLNAPINNVSKVIDDILNKGTYFLEKREAREAKEVAAKYSSNVSKKDSIKDFKDAFFGRPESWVADAIKMRESVRVFIENGGTFKELLSFVQKEFESDGFSEQDAAVVINNKLKSLSKEDFRQQQISEAYHKAKADGSNPELVKAVEELLTPKIEQDAEKQQSGQMREQSVQETTERTSDSDMPIVNETELQDGKVVEEEVVEPPTPPSEPPITITATESPKEVKKTVQTKRAYEGQFREEVKTEIEKYGLTREVENQELAEQRGKDFVNAVGVDAAFEAVKNGDISGAMAAAVLAEAMTINEGNTLISVDDVEIARLNELQGQIIDLMGKIALEGGRYNAMLNRIYQTSDLGFNAERKIQEYKALNNGEISPELEQKFRDLDAQLKDVNKRLVEAEQRAKQAEEKATIEAIKQAAQRDKEAKRTYKQRAKKVADEFRKLKTKPPTFTDANGNVIDITQLGIGWNELVEIGAKAIELSGELADGVKAISDKLKEQDWYAKLSVKDRDAILKQVEEYLSPQSFTEGDIKISTTLLKDLVEGGIDNINDLVIAVQEQIKDQYPNATERQIRDAITGYGKISSLSQDEIDTKLRKMRRLGKLISQLEDIREKKRPLRSGQQRDKLDAEERAKMKEVREAMKDLPMDEADIERQLKTAQDATKTRLQNQIEDLEREIERGEKVPRNVRTVKEDDEIKSLKERRDKLKAESDKLFKDEEFINAKRLEAAKKRTQNSINDLERRLREGDFEKKKPTRIIADDELTKLKAEKIRIKEEFDKEFYKVQLKNRTKFEQWKDRLWEAWNLPRMLMATGEFSFVLIQGLKLSLGNPQLAVKSFKNAMDFFKSEKKSEEWLRDVKSQPYYPIAKESKLALTDFNAELTAREELFYSGWTNWVWNNLGMVLLTPIKLRSQQAYEKAVSTWENFNPLKATERAAVGYLDMLRLQKFLDGMEKLEQQGKTIDTHKQDYKDVADVINTLTGRASIGRLDPVLMSKIFFSPRNWASGFKTATPYALFHFGKMTPTARKLALLEMSKFLGITTSMVALAAAYMNNDDDDETEVEFDMRSTDFMKIRMGNTRVDPWGGMQQQVVFSTRIILDWIMKGFVLFGAESPIKGAIKKNKELFPLGIPNKTPSQFELSMQQAVNKLNPTMSLVYNFANTRVDKEGVLKDKYGNEYLLSEELSEKTYPIFWGTVGDLLKDDPSALDGLLSFYAFFGGGVAVYEDKKKQTKKQGSTLGRVIETTDRQATERQTNERQATSRQAE